MNDIQLLAGNHRDSTVDFYRHCWLPRRWQTHLVGHSIHRIGPLGDDEICQYCKTTAVAIEIRIERGLISRVRMEKALVKVGSIKAGGFWLTKKAKEEINNITDDLNTFSNTVEEKAKWIFNKLKGKPLKTLPDLLREYNLPAGLFPQSITGYEFDESKARLIVHLPSACEVSFKDSSILRYAPRVKCILMRGKLMGIEGMKTKVLVWVKVTNVSVEGHKSDKVWFTAGVKKPRSMDAYRVPCEAISVKEF